MKNKQQNSVHQLIETLKNHPGLTENELMYKTFGYSRNTYESNKKYADLLRRGVEKGLIRREEYKPNRFTYFVNEGVEVEGKDIFVCETPNQNPSLDDWDKSKSECKRSGKFVSDKEVEDLFNYFDGLINKENIEGKHVLNENIEEELEATDDSEVSDEDYESMNNLVSVEDLDQFISSATNIMATLSGENFETKDIFHYLYTRLIANV